MKNIYIYGCSDDLHEVESDFGLRDEFYGDAMLNDARIHWAYNGDWTITIEEDNLPVLWKVRRIKGTSDFIHIQIPDEAEATLKPYNDWGKMDTDDIPGYLMEELRSEFKFEGKIMDEDILSEKTEDSNWVFKIMDTIRKALEASQ